MKLFNTYEGLKKTVKQKKSSGIRQKIIHGLSEYDREVLERALSNKKGE